MVTAQRRSENLQNVPIAVTAITAAKLQQTGIVSTDALFESVPALTVINSSGFLEPRIRGVGNSSAGPSVEDSVSTYVDGVYIASAPGSLLSLNNVDRVEVLKGPQGTLFGRNATGGLIQIVTKDPSSQFGGNADASYGNYDTVRTDLYVTSGVTSGVAADLALSAAHQGDGYGTNLFTGRDTYKTDRDLAARSKWLIHLDPATTLRLAFDFEDIRSSDPSYALPSGTIGAYTTSRVFYPPRDSYLNVDPFHQLKAGGVSLRADHDFGALTLTSISAYRRDSFDQQFDADFSQQAVSDETYNQADEQISQEIQLTPSHKGKLTWVIGAYYFHNNGEYDPLQIASGPPPSTKRTDSFPTLTTQSVAGYAQATYEFLPTWNVTGGFRYTDEQRHIDGELDSTTAAGVTTVTPYVTARTQTDTPTARFSLDHKFTPDILGYFSYNRGFKSGGFNPASPTSPAYAPEYLDAYEFGAKSLLFDHRLRLNLAAYLYEYQNIQVNTYIGTLGVIYNGAAAQLYGLDGDFDYRLTQNLSLNGGLSLIHDRFTNFPNAVLGEILPDGLPTTHPGSATSNRLPFTPDAQLNIGMDYKHDVPRGVADFVFQEQYSTGYYIQPDNVLQQKGFSELNASVTYRPTGTNYFLSIYANNLFDVDVIAFGNINATGENLSYQAPRTFGGRVGVKF